LDQGASRSDAANGRRNGHAPAETGRGTEAAYANGTSANGAQQLENSVALPWYELEWRVNDSRDLGSSRDARLQGKWLILADKGNVGEELRVLLEARGVECISILSGAEFGRTAHNAFHVCPAHARDFERLVSDASRSGPPIRGIVHLWSVDDPDAEDL